MTMYATSALIPASQATSRTLSARISASDLAALVGQSAILPKGLRTKSATIPAGTLCVITASEINEMGAACVTIKLAGYDYGFGVRVSNVGLYPETPTHAAIRAAHAELEAAFAAYGRYLAAGGQMAQGAEWATFRTIGARMAASR